MNEPTPNQQLILKVTDVTFTLSSVNRATIIASGDASTPGWTHFELANPRIGDGILHLDFVGVAPTEIVPQVVTPTGEVRYTQFLAGQPQDVTIHAATNEMSVRLPAIGDPA